MRNIIHKAGVLLSAAILFTTTSCDDFLTTTPRDLLTSDGFYQSPSQCEQGIIGIYADLREITNLEYLYMAECRSDNAWVQPKTDAFREYSEIGTFRAGYDITTYNDVWNKWYKVIYDANIALTKIPDCDFGTRTAYKDQLLGEAHFLRGWAYFELARMFGNVPLIDKAVSPEEAKSIGLSPASEIYAKVIVPDLTAAKSQLPLAKDMVDANKATIAKAGRADKMAAQSMLARIYMTMAGFPLNDASAKSLAETELKAVLTFSETNGNQYWAPDSTEWRKQFMPSDDYYNKYPIFSIQYRSGGTGNPSLFNFGPALPPTYTTIRIFGNSLWVEKSLMYEFSRTFNVNGKTLTDARGCNYSVLTGYDAEPNYPQYSNAKEKLKLDDGSEVEVYVSSIIYKFLPSKRKITALGLSLNVEASMNGVEDWPVNHPVIRLEDIQLMYAEILIGKGDITGAMAIVNKIRNRAGCSTETATTASQALDFVKRERRIELMSEGVRWFDLVRWNDWKSAIEKSFDRYNNPDGTDKSDLKEGRYLFPIPMSQMNIKPGLYPQNTGY